MIIKKDWILFIEKSFTQLIFSNGEMQITKTTQNFSKMKNKKEWKTLKKYYNPMLIYLKITNLTNKVIQFFIRNLTRNN
jgi:hypothetical protein